MGHSSLGGGLFEEIFIRRAFATTADRTAGFTVSFRRATNCTPLDHPRCILFISYIASIATAFLLNFPPLGSSWLHAEQIFMGLSIKERRMGEGRVVFFRQVSE
jgi:hypothetical protein